MIHYRILETGFFYADGGAMFGAIPKKAWSRRYPADENNCCKMAMRCLLVWNDNRVVLIDTGVGMKELGKLSYYNFHDLQDISFLIRSHGFEPEQVTDVVLSHLHFDHCGDCTYIDNFGKLKITFPNAKHWVSEAQWENFLNPNHLEKSSFRKVDLMPAYEAGLVNLLKTDTELFHGFKLELYDGHTDGQIVSIINIDENEIIFPSDVIPTKAHLSTDWISAYDIKPLQTIESKMKLLNRIKEKRTTVIYYHDVLNIFSTFNVTK